MSAPGGNTRFAYRGHTLEFRWTSPTSILALWHLSIVVDNAHVAAQGFVPHDSGAVPTVESLCREAYAAIELMDAPHLSNGKGT